MFEYTCPKCRTAVTTEAEPNGAVTPCGNCGQRLRVVPEDPADTSLLAFGEQAGVRPPRRSWAMPLLAGACGLCGLTIAAGVMLMWGGLGRVPAVVQLAQANQPASPQEQDKGAPPTNAAPGGGKDPADEKPMPPPRGGKDPADEKPMPPPGGGKDPADEKPMPPPGGGKGPADEKPMPPPGGGKDPADEKPMPPPGGAKGPADEKPMPPLGGGKGPADEKPTLTTGDPILPLDPQLLEPTPIPEANKLVADPDLLAEGPEPIEVHIERADKSKVDEKGSLCCVKKGAIWYRRDGSYQLVKIEGKSVRSVVVDAADKKSQWLWDPTVNEFTGTSRPVDRPDLSSHVEGDDSAFLYAAIEQLHKDLDETLWLDDDGLNNIAEAATNYRSLAGAERPKLADLCMYFLRLVKARRERDAGVVKVLADLKKSQDELRSLVGRMQVEQALKGLKDIDPDSAEGYLAYVWRTQIQSLQIDRLEKGALGNLSAQAAKDFNDAIETYEKKVQAQRLRLWELGHEDFGRPDPQEVAKRRDTLSKLLSSNDFDNIKKLYAVTPDEEKNNPFRVCERCLAAAQIPVPKENRREQVERLLGLAKECANAVQMVPRARVYDLSRHRILDCASLLASAAADKELQGEGWKDVYSPAAAYCVRVVDACDGFKQIFQLSGSLRERRAWALAQIGRTGEALDQALVVRDLCKNHPDYGFRLARLYALRIDSQDAKKAAQNAEDAMTWLDYAVKSAGFADIAEMKKNPDLLHVRGRKTRAFTELTAFHITATPLATAGPLFSPRVSATDLQVTNKSPYALTNANIKVDVAVYNPNGTVTYTTLSAPNTIGRIEPEQTIVVENILKGVNGRVDATRVECDQNRK